MRIRRVASILLFYCLVVSIFLAAAYWGSKATDVIARRIPMTRNHTIIIDAGHGGEDGGATSCTGKLESVYNLEIARKLNDLMHLLGLHTKMVRTSDTSVYTQGNSIAEKKVSDLNYRVKLVNETENAILVSIHQNTFPDGQYRGAQVFYAPKGEGKDLAEQLQTALVQTLNPGSNRRSKRADGVYLMEHIQKTGVLVECGFLSNAEEEANLRSEDYQKKLVCVIAATVFNFLDG
ncbi:MAG: N-acetylmuramoyl-L-alanine amidase [Firmicutes bacterium]|nr:N-acetylmuramoyl-L-alanine amidase [Bacillota bacterium]